MSKLNVGQSKFVQLKVLNKVKNQGTLGAFTVTFFGVLTKTEEKDNWTFSGQMNFYDFWNFEAKEKGIRSESSETATEIGAWLLKGGKGFPIYSVPIFINQTSKDENVDWWDNRVIKDIKLKHNEILGK